MTLNQFGPVLDGRFNILDALVQSLLFLAYNPGCFFSPFFRIGVIVFLLFKGFKFLDNIFRRIGEGKSRKEISADLNLSEKTISNYREKIKDKLGLKHSAELARRAVQWVEKQNFRGSTV